MFVRNQLKMSFLLSFLFVTAVFADAEIETHHEDPIVIDEQLSLVELLEITLDIYPDRSWIAALGEEATALAERGNSWLSEPPSLNVGFMEASSGTLHLFDVGITFPLWNLGQRDAEQVVAQQAQLSAQTQQNLLKLRLAGLLRSALWDLRLQDVQHQQAIAALETAEQLVEKVSKLYEYGELAKVDVLLADSERLQKRSALIQARAEVMHARQRYSSITQSNRVPAHYQERLSAEQEIPLNHSALQAVDSLITRKQAEVEAIRMGGSGQTSVRVGVNSDRGNNDPRSNKTESFGIALNIPFGGSAHFRPKIAAAQVELNSLLAQRGNLLRTLELEHHEAEHSLQVNQAELEIVTQLQQIAEQHLKMTELSFSAGETTLLDLLKVQARTRHAILNAQQRKVMLQRDIALYNQAVGQLP